MPAPSAVIARKAGEGSLWDSQAGWTLPFHCGKIHYGEVICQSQLFSCFNLHIYQVWLECIVFDFHPGFHLFLPSFPGETVFVVLVVKGQGVIHFAFAKPETEPGGEFLEAGRGIQKAQHKLGKAWALCSSLRVHSTKGRHEYLWSTFCAWGTGNTRKKRSKLWLWCCLESSFCICRKRLLEQVTCKLPFLNTYHLNTSCLLHWLDALSHLILTRSQWGWYHYPHVADEDMNNLRGQDHACQDLDLTLLLSDSRIPVYDHIARLDLSSP